jgi:hypothetical protein
MVSDVVKPFLTLWASEGHFVMHCEALLSILDKHVPFYITRQQILIRETWSV